MGPNIESSQPHNPTPGEVRKKRKSLSAEIRGIAFTREHGCELQPQPHHSLLLSVVKNNRFLDPDDLWA